MLFQGIRSQVFPSSGSLSWILGTSGHQYGLSHVRAAGANDVVIDLCPYSGQCQKAIEDDLKRPYGSALQVQHRLISYE